MIYEIMILGLFLIDIILFTKWYSENKRNQNIWKTDMIIFDIIIYILGLIMIFFILEIQKLNKENKQLETLKRIDVKTNPKITIYLEKFPYVIDGCGIYDQDILSITKNIFGYKLKTKKGYYNVNRVLGKIKFHNE